MTSHILVIDDEESLRFTLKTFLQDEGYMVSTAASFPEAEELLKQSAFDLIFLDIQLGRHSGLDLLKIVREKFANCPVVMITGAPDVATAAEAVRHGAFDYIPNRFVRKLFCVWRRWRLNIRPLLTRGRATELT